MPDGTSPARSRASREEQWILVRGVAAGIRRRDEPERVANPGRWKSHEIGMHGLPRPVVRDQRKWFDLRRRRGIGKRARFGRRSAVGCDGNRMRTRSFIELPARARVAVCVRHGGDGHDDVRHAGLRRPCHVHTHERPLRRVAQCHHDELRKLRPRGRALPVSGGDRDRRPYRTDIVAARKREQRRRKHREDRRVPRQTADSGLAL